MENNKSKNAYIKYWQVLISILIGVVAYYLPTFVLMVRNKIREMEKKMK